MIQLSIHFGAFVVGLGAVAYALHLIWVHLIKPIHTVVKALVGFAEVYPVLEEIAHEFKPNNGNTLRDQVDMLNIRTSNIEGSVEKLVIIHQNDNTWDGVDRRDT